MKSLRTCISFLFFLTISSPANAQVAQVYRDRGIQKISRNVRVFFDSTGKMQPEELSRPENLSRFRPVKGDFENLNITKSIVWLHFNLVVDSADNYFVHSEPPLANDIRLYHKTGNGWNELRSGLDYSPDRREIKLNAIVFPLHIQPGDTGEYFIRLESYFPKLVLLDAGTEKSYWANQFSDSIFAGIFLGIMLIMALYNFFLFLTNRDRVYVYYALYVLTTVIFICFTSGFIVLFPDFFRVIFNWSHIFFPVLFGYFGVLFTMRFLNTKKYAPRMHISLFMLMVLVTIIFFISFFAPHLGTTLVQGVGMLLSLISLATGFVVHAKGYAPARYYLFGFGIYMTGLFAYILLAFVDIDTGMFTPPRILMASSAIEAIILSFAIGDKLNIAVRDKQAAQEEAMNAVRENERIVREQNIVLEKKVEERTAEISEQKSIIEEKNKDILDSIHYAKRIQRALLASDSLLQKNLPEYFVFYKPKDIVSGDFYWADEMPDGKFLLITGDCTGHGVPGAFMSLLNISILHELTNGLRLSRPDEILNTQRDAIIMSLNPEGSEEISKDGMDCVLCSFDFKNKKIEFACANNPLWILRKGEMLSYKPDKFPIGMHEGEKKMFSLQQEDLQPGDIVYTFTDGFADQFGGPRGKKFKYTQLKEKLIEIGHLPLTEQKEKLDIIFQEWKGNLEQIDDVLVIGVKI